MRRIIGMAALAIVIVMAAAACGAKSADQVVADLDQVVSKLESYQGSGKMTLHTGEQPQEYNVEVWYKTPHYYRIALTNAQKDITQIVLRNDEGVFVLTPHLNKMFRFQSDWPEKSGQVYLYQSLVQSIVMDTRRQFAEEKDAYVFDVAANYQNSLLARQKIWLSKKDYAPRHVEVTDDNSKTMVTVDFTHFEFGKKFDKDSFDMERNMATSRLQTLPTGASANVGDLSAGGTGDADAKAAGSTGSGGKAGNTAAAQAEQRIITPQYVPQGVKQQDMKEVKLGEEKAILFRYSGTYNYTLLESTPQARTVTTLPGDIVELGYTLGVLTGDAQGLRTLTWTHDGIEFRLTTSDLPQDEMLRIAQSVQGQVGK